jgi:hypothetical protein
MERISRFQAGRGSTTYKCRVCGKRTRETGEDESIVELCLDCYEEAGFENEHLDNNGDHHGLPGFSPERCPVCRSSD